MNRNHLDARLKEVFDELNEKYFSMVLPDIELKFSGRLQTSGGQYFSKPVKRILISLRYLDFADPWKEIADTLGHEMVHYWLDFQGLPCGHTPLFRKKLKECGFSRFSRLKPRWAKIIYECPQCGLEYFRRRRGIWSCGPCSKGRFKIEFKLREKIAHLKSVS